MLLQCYAVLLQVVQSCCTLQVVQCYYRVATGCAVLLHVVTGCAVLLHVVAVLCSVVTGCAVLLHVVTG